MTFWASQNGVSRAYIFWVASLMFGLPLITSFYAVWQMADFVTAVLAPYLAICAALGLVIWRQSPGSKPSSSDRHNAETSHGIVEEGKYHTAPNRFSYYLAFVSLGLATIGIISFGIMKYNLAISYPEPSLSADLFGGIYLIFISSAFAIGFPTLLYLAFPVIRRSFASDRNNLKIAFIVGAAYFFTYLILVNQIIIIGYNMIPNNYIPSPSGLYPYAHVFTAGPPPDASAEALVYVPMALVQLNKYLNFLIQPFEVIFAIVLSTLVGVTVIVTRSLIGSRANHSCYTGAAVSGVGGFIGFTATCPSCLVPTMISVFFGGFSSVAAIQLLYSNLFGVLIPPVVSIVALLVSLVLLNSRGLRILNGPQENKMAKDATVK